MPKEKKKNAGKEDKKPDTKGKAGQQGDGKGKKSKASNTGKAVAGATAVPVSSTPFSSSAGKNLINASGVAALADGRFLFCDNLSSAVLYELRFSSPTSRATIEPRPLRIEGGTPVEDLEAMTAASSDGKSVLFAVSSLGLRKSKGGGGVGRPGGLVRIVEDGAGGLRGEVLSGFRDWIAQHVPEVAAVMTLDPDAGGLNIEGLAWDAGRQMLLLGLRTPVRRGKPLVVPIRVKDLGAPWTPANLECLPAIALRTDPAWGEAGIRGIEFDPSRGVFLVICGRAVSGTATPFRLYAWDGNDQGSMSLFGELWFDQNMKPESVAAGTVAGKPVLVFMDDSGGYQIVPEDDHRLKGGGIGN